MDKFWDKIIDSENKIEPSIEAVTEALVNLGNPQNDYRSIHITGTNGKTSTTFLISKLLIEAGLKVGTFTSPHLTNPLERIQINGEKISLKKFKDIYNIISLGNTKLSFFETMTVCAYYIFSNEAVDVAIIEVGMGGKWDATNVIRSDVSVITTIALDHQNYLGDTIYDIALEKAGIINEDQSIVLAKQKDEPISVFTNIIEENEEIKKSSKLFLEDLDFSIISSKNAVGGTINSYKTMRKNYNEIPLSLFGEHQVHNSLLAIVAVEEFFQNKLSNNIVEKVFGSISIPGRAEKISNDPLIIVDSAHNPNGIDSLVKTILSNYGHKFNILFSCFIDKNAEEMLFKLKPICNKLILTTTNNIRSYPLDDLKDIALGIYNIENVIVYENIKDAIYKINSDKNNGAIITGSIDLIGNIKKLFLNSKQ